MNRKTLAAHALLVALFLAGCSKPNTDASSQASATADTAASAAPTVSVLPDAATSPQPAVSATTGAVTTTTTAMATPVSAAAPSQTTTATTASIVAPTSTDVVPFDGASLIAAYAALPSAAVTQADAVVYALLAAKTGLACDGVRKDFSDEFAAHRDIDTYMHALTARAKPMGYASIDLQTNLGQYDFNGKKYQIGGGYGDGSSTFAFNYPGTCNAPWVTMPDKTNVYSGEALEADDGDRLHAYPIAANQAEDLEKNAYKYQLTEHLVFYPTAIARREDGRMGAVVHVTKVVLQERPTGAPMSAVPTILMSSDIP